MVRVFFLSIVLLFGLMIQGGLVVQGQDTPGPVTEGGAATTDVKTTARTLSLSSLSVQATEALTAGESESAIACADAMLRQHRDDANAMRVAADIYLRTGKVKSASRLFDRYVRSSPRGLPGLWQRGIALYLIGEYEKAAEQFEEHRKVNPNDVENAAWHFLCVAKAKSAEAARKLVLPAPNDSRIPMEQIHQMLSAGNTHAVVKAMEKTVAGSKDRAEAEFYGNFYLGLYADALGDPEKAHQHLSTAADDAPHHYMGDVARVYATHLATQTHTSSAEPKQ